MDDLVINGYKVYISILYKAFVNSLTEDEWITALTRLSVLFVAVVCLFLFVWLFK